MAGFGGINVVLTGVPVPAESTSGRLRYRRPFSGMTVAEVIRRLNSGDPALGALPKGRRMVPILRVNKKYVSLDSKRTFMDGDTLKGRMSKA